MSKKNHNNGRSSLVSASASIGNGSEIDDTTVAIVLESQFREAYLEYLENHPEVIQRLIGAVRNDPEILDIVDEMVAEKEKKPEKKKKLFHFSQ